MDKHKIQYEKGQVIKSDLDVQEANSLAIYAEIPLIIVEKYKEGSEIYETEVFCAEDKQSILELQTNTKAVDVIALDSGESLYPITTKYT